MQYVRENELREAIRQAISSENKPTLTEQTQSFRINISSQQFWDALIQPWIDVLKIAKLEAQKTLANLLTLFRLMTSFNRQKIQNIKDKHATRMRGLNQETQSLLDAMPISTDMAVLGFLLNPAQYVSMKSRGGKDVVHGVAEWFKGAGFGDYTAGELGSLDREVIARVRKREESGLIVKALRGLNSLFMAGYDPVGEVLLEQDELADEEGEAIPPFEERDFGGVELTADGVSQILDAGGGLPGIKEAQEGMLEDANEFLDAVKSASKLVELLGSIAEVQDLDQYMSVLDQISKVSPEAGATSKSQVEQALNADVKSIASTEGAEEEAAKMVLKRQGNSDPTEEELAEVTQEQKEAEIRSIAFGNILGQLRASASEASQGIYDTHKDAYDTLYPEDVEPGVKEIIDNSKYGQTIEKAGDLLDAMKASVSALGA